MTPEEIVNTSHHFRMIMNSLKKKYPYIIGYELPENFNEKWSEYNYNFFVNLVISKSKALELRPNWQTYFWVDGYDEYDAVFLTLIFEEKEGESGPSPKEDERGIDSEVESLYNTKHIPKDIKIKKQPGVSKYILKP